MSLLKIFFVLSCFFTAELFAGESCQDSFKDSALFRELPDKPDEVAHYFEILKEVLSSKDIYKRELAVKFFAALVEREQNSFKQKPKALVKLDELALTAFNLLINHLKETKMDVMEQLLIIDQVSKMSLNHPSSLLSIQLVPEILSIISKTESLFSDSFARIMISHVVKYPEILAETAIKSLLKIPIKEIKEQNKHKGFISKVSSVFNKQLENYNILSDKESLKESLKEKDFSYKRQKDTLVKSITEILIKLPEKEQNKISKLLQDIHQDQSYPYVVRSMALKSYGEFSLYKINPNSKYY